MRCVAIAMTATLLLAGCGGGSISKKAEDGSSGEFHVVYFETNGSPPITAVKVTDGSKLPQPVDPTNPELVFIGWYDSPSFIRQFNFNADIRQDTKIYAKWLPAREKKIASDATNDHEFGDPVAISGDYAVASSYVSDHRVSGQSSGSVYIFRWNGNTWVEYDILTTDSTNDGFGTSVDIAGDYIIVGTNMSFEFDSESNISGSAYIYYLNPSTEESPERKWNLVQKIDGSSQQPRASSFFGSSVAISENYAIIADFFNQTTYIFKRTDSTWAITDILKPEEDDVAASLFGNYVAISDDYAVVTAYSTGNRGDVYVFTKVGQSWNSRRVKLSQQNSNVQLESTANGYFGNTVAISGDSVVVSAKKSANDPHPIAYVYRMQVDGITWDLESKLIPTNLNISADGLFLGNRAVSVAMNRNHVALGLYYADRVYIFERQADDSWLEKKQLNAESRGGEFGNSVAISEDSVVLVGAPQEENFGKKTGSVYFIRGY